MDYSLLINDYGRVLKISFRKNPVVCRDWVMMLFLIFIPLTIYSNTVQSPFVFDDRQNILYNPYIQIQELSISNILQAGLKSYASSRPVANISFALNYYLFGYSTASFRVLNILIHIATGILLYFLLKAILCSSKSCLGEKKEWIAFFTALIWLVHPLQIQSVTYIVQRMNSMASMFFVATLLFYSIARSAKNPALKTVLFIGAISSSILSFGSKEISATLPFFIILYEFYFLQKLNGRWIRKHMWYMLILLSVVAFVSLIYMGGDPLPRVSASYSIRNFTPFQRILTECRVIVYYISLIVFPHPSRLNLDHSFEISTSFLNPITTLFSIVFILILIIISVFIARKKLLISFCLIWFFGNLVIESSIIGLEIIFEHRTYLPSMFLILMAVIFLGTIFPLKRFIFIGLIVSAVLSFWTYERNITWQSRASLWRDAVEKSPEKARPHHNLGIALCDEGRLEEALAEYNKALTLDPGLYKAANNIGLVLIDQGKVGEAIDYLNSAKKRFPNADVIRYNLGRIYTSLKRSDEAINEYFQAIQINPSAYLAHNNLGFELARRKGFAASLYHYTEAIRLNAYNADTHNNIGNLLFRMGKIDRGVHHYKTALDINPHFRRAFRNYTKASELKTRIDNAVISLRKRMQTLLSKKHVITAQDLKPLNTGMIKLKMRIESYKNFLKKQDMFVPEFFNINNYSMVFCLKEDWQDFFDDLNSEKQTINLKNSPEKINNK